MASFEITPNTLIDKGLRLSQMYLLDHVSSGAYHPMFNKWLPEFPAKLIPSQSGGFLAGLAGSTPLWKVVQNLQKSTEFVLDGLTNEFGSDLQIHSGFLNKIDTLATSTLNQLNHVVGNSFDISVSGFDNPYLIAKDLTRMIPQVSGISVIYGIGQSYFHLDIDQRKLADSYFSTNDPIIKSFDLITGVVENGIQAYRGYS